MMKMERLSEMDGGARIWVFQSSQQISAESAEKIRTTLNTFLENWAAHGQALFSGFEIRNERFIIVAVDEAQAGATGCSIDSMMKVIQEVDAAFDLNLLDRMKIAYWVDRGIVETSVHSFSESLKAGQINPDTIVFNNVITTLEDLKTKWQVPVRDSWASTLIPAQ
jgi:hypothetical protein